MMLTTEQRITRLESDAYQAKAEAETTRGAIAHLTDAVGDLSQGFRALRHEIDTEIVPRLDRIDGRLDRIDGRLDRMDGRLDGLETAVSAHGQLLRAIATHLQVPLEARRQ